jgi:predicted Zn finger-like uncharacterized protein
MRIICPQCGFESNVDLDKIPPRAKLATCPKCKFKFQFRELEPEGLPHEETAAQSPQPPAAPMKTPQAYGPEGKPAASAPLKPDEPAPDEKPAAEEPRQSKSEDDEDFWDKLEALAPENPEAPHDEEPFDPAREFKKQSSANREGFEDSFSSPPPDLESLSIEIPFEDADNFSFFAGLIATIRRVLLHPRLFFSTMPLPRGMIRPLLYYVITSELLAIIMFVWMAVGLAVVRGLEGGETSGMLAQLSSMNNDPLSLVIYPLVAVVSLYVRTAVTHLTLMLLGKSKGGFEGTFRAFAYGATPYVLAVFPVAGLIVGGLMSVVYTIIGLMRLHQIGVGKALLAYVLPIAAWFLFLYFMLQAPLGSA